MILGLLSFFLLLCRFLAFGMDAPHQEKEEEADGSGLNMKMKIKFVDLIVKEEVNEAIPAILKIIYTGGHFDFQDAFGRVPLVEAYKSLALISQMVFLGNADPDFQDGAGDILLSRMLGCITENSIIGLIINILNKTKTAANYVEGKSGRNLLTIYMANSKAEHLELIEALLETGVPCDKEDPSVDVFPVEYACMRGWYRSFRLFLDREEMPRPYYLKFSPSEHIRELGVRLRDLDFHVLLEFWAILQVMERDQLWEFLDPFLTHILPIIMDPRRRQEILLAVDKKYNSPTPSSTTSSQTVSHPERRKGA